MKINNKKGLTLVELVITIALIGLIAVVFMPIFLLSAKTNNQSEDKLKATYLGKDAMEMVYNISKEKEFNPVTITNFGDGYVSLGDNVYEKKLNDDIFKGTITIKLTEAIMVNNSPSSLIKVIVVVKDEQNKQDIRYESLYAWKGRGK